MISANVLGTLARITANRNLPLLWSTVEHPICRLFGEPVNQAANICRLGYSDETLRLNSGPSEDNAIYREMRRMRRVDEMVGGDGSKRASVCRCP